MLRGYSKETDTITVDNTDNVSKLFLTVIKPKHTSVILANIMMNGYPEPYINPHIARLQWVDADRHSGHDLIGNLYLVR